MADQAEHRAAMRARVLARLDQLAEAARAAGGYDSVNGTKSPEVGRLDRRVREVSLRWAPVWRSGAAAEAVERGERTEADHVVPVEVLVQRILRGAPVEAVLGQSVICDLTVDEHRRVLPTLFRRNEPEAWAAMMSCGVSALADLGWERYQRAGIVDCFDL